MTCHRPILFGAFAAALAAGSAAAYDAAYDAAPQILVQLRPLPSPEGGGIGWVDVQLSVAGANAPRFRLPLIVNNVETIAADLADVQASDGAGALTLRTETEGSNGGGTRFWVPARPTQGTVTIRYRAPIGARSAARGAAPPLELRGDGNAFSGAGSTFLLLPADERPYHLGVRWDLTALARGATAASSLGPDNASSPTPKPLATLERSFFMAGEIGHSAQPSADPFFAAWQGKPPFDTNALMAWTAGLHKRFTAFFRVEKPERYTVFLRPNPVNAGGGVGLAGSFVATYGDETKVDKLKLTLVHEMFHTFAPSISDPGGLASSWFGEGLATHYQRVLPLRFGMISADEFLKDLNSTAARYYTSAMAEAPNAEIPGRFWEDTRIRTLPYDRGALYFADLDHRLKTHSGGKRSLDDLLFEMTKLQRGGKELANADWEQLLRRHLGQAGVDHFQQMLAGRPPLPASEAFGPCFRRTTKPLRRYELGFDPKVLVEQPRIVRGLISGSAADAAGLRTGDEITKPVPQDGIQGDQQALLRLEIRRNGRVFPLSYLPRGETVQAYQWERVATRSRSCAT